MWKGTSSRKMVSLSNELHLLMDSIHGVRSLTKQWIDSFGMDQDVPHQVSALLVVLIERIRLIDRVVRGNVDPRLAWSPQNDGQLVPGDPDEEDVLLSAWSDRRLARHHRARWRRLKARLGSKLPPAREPKAKEGAP